WAALIREAGAAAGPPGYPPPTPPFAPPGWAWVEALPPTPPEIPRVVLRPPPQEQQAIADRFWAEGRLKLEPWLAPRVQRDGITLWPNTRVTGSEVTQTGDLCVRFDRGPEVAVDRVILATGYRMEW